MWQTNTYWFDVALAMTVFMLGQLSFGRFVEHQPRWRRLIKSALGVALLVGSSAYAGRRLIKSALGVALLVGSSAYAGRMWMYVLLGAIALGVAIVHGWWLPRNGINGWTAEPRDRYYALMKLDAAGKRLDRAR